MDAADGAALPTKLYYNKLNMLDTEKRALILTNLLQLESIDD